MVNAKKIALAGALCVSTLLLAACNLYQPSSKTSQTSQTAVTPVVGNVILYSESGFLPSSIKVKVGQKVAFKNNSKVAVQVNSAPHPTHTLYPELNIGSIAPGETQLTTFNKAGTYKYHNHLNASQNGTIVVE